MKKLLILVPIAAIAIWLFDRQPLGDLVSNGSKIVTSGATPSDEVMRLSVGIPIDPTQPTKTNYPLASLIAAIEQQVGNGVWTKLADDRWKYESISVDDLTKKKNTFLMQLQVQDQLALVQRVVENDQEWTGLQIGFAFKGILDASKASK